MILAKEFNRSFIARDSGEVNHSPSSCISSRNARIPVLTCGSDFTISTEGQTVPTIVQFGANSPLEVSRAASLVAPYVNGVDINCGCPQSWACAETLGAALMEQRELVRDMVVEMRQKLRGEGWAVGKEKDINNPKGRSISVKIRVHKDLR